MFAVIRTGGKQYKVEKNDKIHVEKLEDKEGASVTIDDVLMLSDGKSPKVGSPTVSGAKVVAKVVEHVRSPKIVVFKKKRRHNYRRKAGHRQNMTVLEITDIKAA
ncbi:MAG: 50S ribosomal protein L21 [Pseudomonadota bacterium]